MSVAMLITPAATARLITNRIETMTAVAVCVGVTSAVSGLTISYHLATPPGPSIALVTVAWFAGATVVSHLSSTARRHRRHNPPPGTPPLVPPNPPAVVP
jgi:ABC-type Mn2+/Zn2+ transport system permease subunit